jgi:hypothetical protein
MFLEEGATSTFRIKNYSVMEAAHSSEMFLPIYQIMWHQILENIWFSTGGQWKLQIHSNSVKFWQNERHIILIMYILITQTIKIKYSPVHFYPACKTSKDCYWFQRKMKIQMAEYMNGTKTNTAKLVSGSCNIRAFHVDRTHPAWQYNATAARITSNFIRIGNGQQWTELV